VNTPGPRSGYWQSPEHVAARCKPRVWTPARLWQLAMLLEQGRSDAAIGRELGVTANAVNVARKRHGLQSRHRLLLSAHEVSTILGLPDSTRVGRWIRYGWLVGRRGQRWGRWVEWFVTRNALASFLADERYWPLWEPSAITDPWFRRHAASVRRDVRYLTPSEVAWRFGVARMTAFTWMRTGQLPAMQCGRRWFAREGDVSQFQPPRIGRPPKEQ
jgi:hypothetical protein